MEVTDKKGWARELFLRYEGRLLRYTMKFTSHEKASEIVQDSFLKLLKQDPKKLQGKELAWLFRVSRNRALDLLKKEKPMSQFKTGQEIPFESDNADERIQKDEQKNRITQMISQLNPNQKEVIRLKFQEELSYKEISDITGQSVSHVGVIVHKAIKKLRTQLAEPTTNQEGGAQ